MPVDISVVMPTFQRPHLIGQAIASVLAQSGVTCEILVIDDSPEGSAETTVAGLGDERVRYLKNPNPTGGFPSIVRNMGWPLTQGRFLHFLDDDDLVPDGYYQVALAAFAQNERTGVVFGRIDPFGDASEQQMQHERDFFHGAAKRALTYRHLGQKLGLAAAMMFDQTMLVCGAAIIRRDCVERLGGFDPKLRLGEDVDFFARAIREFGACYLDRVSLLYRIGFPSLMHAPVLSEKDIKDGENATRQMHAKYRLARGSAEFFSMKLLARLIVSPLVSILA